MSRSEGGGVVATNPFTEDTNSPEILVTKLFQEEEREVDDDVEERTVDGKNTGVYDLVLRKAPVDPTTSSCAGCVLGIYVDV